jgi:amino acid adenylation domain-containing protein
MSLLFNEVISLYSKLTTGLDDAALPSLNSFSDFVESEKKYLLSASFEQDRQFWLRQYRNQIESRAFYSCMKTGSSDVLTCRRAELTISRELFEKIDAFCRPLNCSILSYFISQILLLNKLYNNEDAVIGLPLFNRNGSTFKKTLGPFVNAIPFSADINFSDTFLQFLLQIKDRLNASFRHSAFPLINTLKELDVKGNIYNVIFSYQKNAFHRAINDSTIDIRYLPAVGQKEDLVFQLLEYSKTDDLRLVLSYKESLFSVEIIDRLLQHFFNLLESSFLKAELRLDQFTCLAPQEENYLIHGVNDTKREFPEDKTIATLFEEQSQRTPDNIALIFEAKELSYRHLNEEANRFADYLFKNYSLQRNSVILVSLERNEDLIISLLGVLKAECTYLSVDPEYPEERIHHICSESGAVVTITEKIMKEFFQQKLSYSSLNPVNHQQAEDNFCIIYTSGSTGMPKGCILSNRGVVNNMFSKIDLLKMKEGTTICHNAETYFVGSLWQLWTPLICGARVVLCNYEELRDLGKLFDKARFYGCGVLTVIPSQLQEYLNRADRAQMQTISTLILTGEKLDPQLIEKCHLLNPDLRIVNTYGQTESTDDITFYTIPVSHSAEVMPVGTATQNMSMYILSQDGALCPVGVLGEVYTSGVGIAKGYVKNYQLTREKFVPNPFRVGQIMYRTGDVGRWLENGFIEVVGRIDEQVKIRGYRVELAEIRKVLLCYRGIDEVVLLFKEKDSKGPIIIAYMICEEGIDVKAIRSFLLSKIPYYMLPGYYIRVNNFPLLPNGKVDKKKLFEGEGDLMSASADYVKPKNEVEQKLVDIWESVLKRSNIGVQDNFFDLGGHSLSAMTIINLVKSVFNVTVNIKEIFENPQISTLAEEVQKAIWVQQSESGPGVEHESREIIRL